MAIIRKGDKAAELQLKIRAIKQSTRRMDASDSRKTKAGLAFTNKSKTAITSDPSKIMVSKDKSGKVSATYRGEPFEGPVSGGAISASKNNKKKSLQRNGSGVIKGGKLVKGSAALQASVLKKNPKRKSK